MFVTVKYGDGEHLLCNPDCKTDVLLDDIRRRCSYEKGVIVDLSDESGNLKYLRDHPQSYATDFLKDRESLVLIRVDKNPIDEAVTYTPLLDDVFIVTSAFVDRLTRCGDSGIKQSQAKNGNGVLSSNMKKHQAVSKARHSFLTSASKSSRSSSNRSSSRNQSKDRGKTK